MAALLSLWLLAGPISWSLADAQAINNTHPLDFNVDDIQWSPPEPPGVFFSQLNACPAPCQESPEAWTVYSSFERLKECDEPLLFDTSLYNPLDDHSSNVKIRACSTSPTNFSAIVTSPSKGDLVRRQSSTSCTSIRTQAHLEFSWSTTTVNGTDSVLQAINAMSVQKANLTEPTILFSFFQGIVSGLYVGQGFTCETQGSVIDSIKSHLNASGQATPGSFLGQLCGSQRNSRHTFGLIVSAEGDVVTVQKTLKSWNEASCATITENVSIVRDVDVWETTDPAENGAGLVASNQTTPTNGTGKFSLTTRDTPLFVCTTTTVVSGDSCASLAARCGVSPHIFSILHKAADFCSTLMPGQRVCCSLGVLPDIRPKPGADGVCATYLVKAGDSCSAIAAANGLSVNDLGTFNDKTTWGWTGCNGLMAGTNICLSTGKPPFPASVSNAVCGPTSPGAGILADQTLADAKPCPLNACCNIWGQCGITPDFCTIENGPTGNPGTSPPGKNGCISNCGMDITNRDKAAALYERIGYYESWNWGRNCLHMSVDQTDTKVYTHVHYAFASIGSDFSVVVDDQYHQWSKFKALSVKKIVSIGGWGLSTDPATYNSFRNAISPSNRDTFAAKVVEFVNREGLHGVDFDWEYPGAPDIPGIPPGKPDDGINYLKFLATLRKKMGTSKSISIAAPASYWYLRGFPLYMMEMYVDYIVYMTYDLHGQWDAGNKWAADGCPEGSCIRSHVNFTETNQALAMITKAGVPTNKIFVGETSYGRSFKMERPGCVFPTCHFLGDSGHSPATPGRCTGVGGYLANAEIDEIFNTDPAAVQWYDKSTDSDYMTYGDNQYVAYMSTDTKNGRRIWWSQYNFAGTVDWAIDLQEFDEAADDSTDGTEDDSDDDDTLPPGGVPNPPCLGDGFQSLADLHAATDSIPGYCLDQYTLATLATVLQLALDKYNKVAFLAYDSFFNAYAKAVVGSAGQSVADFYNKNGNKYFDCQVTEQYTCCDYCHTMHGNNDHPDVWCRYCDNSMPCYDPNADSTHGQGRQPLVRHKNIAQPCPPDYSQRGEIAGKSRYSESVYWTLRDGDKDSFYADLLNVTGIPQSKIGFGNYHYADSGDKFEYWDFNAPAPHGYTQADVANPKTMLSQSVANFTKLVPQIRTAANGMKAKLYSGDSKAMIDAVSLPVLLFDQGVDNIEDVRKAGEAATDAEVKEFMMSFLTSLFFIIPGIGEVIGPVAATASRIAIAAGVAGNAALDIATIIENPSNAPLAIMGLVMAPLGLADAAAMDTAASVKRGIKADDVARMGSKLSGNMDTLKAIGKTCKV